MTIRRIRFSILLGVLFFILGVTSPYYVDAFPFLGDHDSVALALAIIAPVVGVSLGGLIDRRVRQSAETVE